MLTVQPPRTRQLSAASCFLVALAALRLLRGWNQTGQKFAGGPDIVKLFLIPCPQMLWVIVGLAYVLASFQILAHLGSLPFVVATSVTSVLVSAAFAFKLAFTAEDAPELVVGFAKTLNDKFEGQSLLSRARVVFAVLALLATFAVYRAVRAGRHDGLSSGMSPHCVQEPRPGADPTSPVRLLHHLYTLLAMTQSRATNIPLLLLSTVIFQCLASADLSVAEITTSSILLQHASFFASGGSNAISSVDLSSAYNGIGGFNVVAVGLLTFVGNWAGPIFWTSATSLLLLQKRGEGAHGDCHHRHLALLTVFTTASAASVMAACTALRTHLFIWTVFSPKYLYCMAWSLGQHLAVNVSYGSLLFWLGARP